MTRLECTVIGLAHGSGHVFGTRGMAPSSRVRRAIRTLRKRGLIRCVKGRLAVRSDYAGEALRVGARCIVTSKGRQAYAACYRD